MHCTKNVERICETCPQQWEADWRGDSVKAIQLRCSVSICETSLLSYKIFSEMSLGLIWKWFSCKHVIEERKDVEADNDEGADIDNAESLYDSKIWDVIIASKNI